MNSNNSSPLLTVKIIFEGKLEPSSKTLVFVSIIDVTRADAPSRAVLQHVIENIDKMPNQEIKLYGRIPDKESSYAVRVHVDVDGDGKVSVGDYITMESYPVLTYGYPNYVSVRVKKVEKR